jgi:transcriptional regulator with XRE-family HTH domain
VRTWLRGKTSPSWRTLRAIVDVYGVAPEKLLPVRKAA